MQVQISGNGATPAVDPLAHVRALLDLLPAGACLCDRDGRITHYTAQAAALWGVRPALDGDGAPRWSGAARLYREDGSVLPHAGSWIARAIADGAPHHGRSYQVGRPDGERRHVIGYASPVLDATGEVVGGLDLMVDVTDRQRAAQAERQRLLARGEQLVALACDIRAHLTPLRRAARDTGRGDAGFDDQLRQITRLVDRVLNLEVDAD